MRASYQRVRHKNKASNIVPRSFQTDIEVPDIRPTLLSLAALMLLLIPILLLIVNPQKTTYLPLSMSTSSGVPPIAHTGPIEVLKISIDTKSNSEASDPNSKYVMQLEVHRRKSDVRASQGDTEIKIWDFTSLDACIQKLRDIKGFDEARERITVIPSKNLRTGDIVFWMDILRQDNGENFYPSVVLESSQSNLDAPKAKEDGE